LWLTSWEILSSATFWSARTETKLCRSSRRRQHSGQVAPVSAVRRVLVSPLARIDRHTRHKRAWRSATGSPAELAEGDGGAAAPGEKCRRNQACGPSALAVVGVAVDGRELPGSEAARQRASCTSNAGHRRALMCTWVRTGRSGRPMASRDMVAYLGDVVEGLAGHGPGVSLGPNRAVRTGSLGCRRSGRWRLTPPRRKPRCVGQQADG
jgi:hypothetical protein